MAKIAMIGAGSLVFCKTLIGDFLSTPALVDSEIRLMSRTGPKLEQMRRYVGRVVEANRLPTRVSATLNLEEALADADYVVVMVQIGGLEAFAHDYEIPLRYGVDQCIGDSLGPGGVFRGLRHIAFLKQLAEAMQRLCPNAYLLNYANPMGACCTALASLGIDRFVGLCHGVQTTLDLISRYVDVPKHRIDHLCAGINHMAWFLELRDKADGRDLYPQFKAVCERPEYFVNEKVRIEVMRHFGYFMTESTGHLSEYVPWFRKNERALRAYCDQPEFGGASGAYFKYTRDITSKYAGVDYLASESTSLCARSVEYCSYILEAIEDAKAFSMNGNVVNRGLIANLPEGCCVEVPLVVDGQGIHPRRVGKLPTGCAALNMSNVQVQLLAAEAGLTGDPELVMQALAMDPLTAAVLDLDQIRRMTSELLDAERPWLPQFEGRFLARRPFIQVPADVRGVDVPLDPALAIAHRFGELARAQVGPGTSAA
jgi:alpha-galactosidase